MIGDIDAKDELIDRAVRALSALPAANPLATARIASAVRARRAHREQTPVWLRAATTSREWLAERSVSMPGAMLLAAASLVLGFVMRGEVTTADQAVAVAPSATQPGVPVAPAAASPLTAGSVAVSLVFTNTSARSVSVVGDFNGWDPSAVPMQRFGAEGAWTASVLVRPGRHTYAFLVDGATLVADPRAPRAKSVDYGGDASVMMVRMP